MKTVCGYFCTNIYCIYETVHMNLIRSSGTDVWLKITLKIAIFRQILENNEDFNEYFSLNEL